MDFVIIETDNLEAFQERMKSGCIISERDIYFMFCLKAFKIINLMIDNYFDILLENPNFYKNLDLLLMHEHDDIFDKIITLLHIKNRFNDYVKCFNSDYGVSRIGSLLPKLFLLLCKRGNKYISNDIPNDNKYISNDIPGVYKNGDYLLGIEDNILYRLISAATGLSISMKYLSDKIQILLKYGYDPNKIYKTEIGKNVYSKHLPLNLFISFADAKHPDYMSVLKVLLQYGADPLADDTIYRHNSLDGVEYYTGNSIEFCKNKNIKELLEMYVILEKSNPMDHIPGNINCLMLVSFHGYHTILKKYISSGLITNINFQDSDGNTVAHYAVEYSNSWETMKYLSEAGADFYLPNAQGISPFDVLNKNNNNINITQTEINLLIITNLKKNKNSLFHTLVSDICFYLGYFV